MVVVVLDALAGKILLLQVMVQLLRQLQHKLDQLRRQLQLLPEHLFHRSQAQPATVTPAALPAHSPGAAAPHTFSRDHGGDGGVTEDDGSQDGDNDVVRPETINASRRDSDNARLLLAGDDVLEGFDKCGVSSLITHICLISVLQLADLFLYAG